jgi:hypothetical protein
MPLVIAVAVTVTEMFGWNRSDIDAGCVTESSLPHGDSSKLGVTMSSACGAFRIKCSHLKNAGGGIG